VSYYCQSREKQPAGFICNKSEGPCDFDSVCTGKSFSCPKRTYKNKTTVCRAAVGLCDYTEYCPGNASACPDDEVKPAGTECNKSYECTDDTGKTICNETYQCDGRSGYCPFEEPVIESANRIGFNIFYLIVIAAVSMMVLISMI